MTATVIITAPIIPASQNQREADAASLKRMVRFHRCRKTFNETQDQRAREWSRWEAVRDGPWTEGWAFGNANQRAWLQL